MSQRIPACPPHVKAAFDAMPAKQRKVLLALRKLILQTHRDTTQAGLLVEDLRWGQPSYLTDRPQTGSTIRLGLTKQNEPALYAHCGTTLIGDFRRAHGSRFEFEGNRALLPGHDINAVRTELSWCIKQALTYKLRAR
jgi:hypothetical protein